MRIVVRIAGVVLALVAVLVVAALVALPRLLASDAVRERIQSAGRDATGREVGYAALDMGWLPPRIVVREPRIAGDAGGEPAFSAREVSLVLRLGPLLTRRLVVDSLALDGATTRVLRTADGLVHPFQALEEEAPEAPAEADAEEPSSDEGFSLELRRLTLRDSRVVVEDRTVDPPAEIVLSGLAGEARGGSGDAPLDFELRGALATGGDFEARGRRESGAFRLDVDLHGVRLELAAPYLREGMRAGGAATGTVAVRRPSAAPVQVSVDVEVADGALVADELAVDGPFSVRAELAGAAGAAEGDLDVDATGAQLRYGPSFVKPPGQTATARGRLVPGPDGIELRDTRLNIKNFEAEVQLRSGARGGATLVAPPFELEGWGELLPALAGLDPRGRVALPALEIRADPLRLDGRIELDGVTLRRGDGPSLRLDGAWLAEGTVLRSRGLVASLAEQPVHLEATLLDIATAPRFEARVRADDLDSAALLGALGDADETTLSGPLDLRGSFSGPLEGDAPLAESLEGRLRFDIAPGRLEGVSLLRSAFEGVGQAAEAAEIASRARGDEGFDRYYGDEFESLGGTLQLSGGRARSDDIELVYRHYRVSLRGTVGLVDRALDLTGRLTIDPEVDGRLASGEPAAPAAGRTRVIPLARVEGTLDAPHVVIDSEDALGFAALYATDRRRAKWERKLDERLGEGAGREVLDALDQILSGQEPRP